MSRATSFATSSRKLSTSNFARSAERLINEISVMRLKLRENDPDAKMADQFLQSASNMLAAARNAYSGSTINPAYRQKPKPKIIAKQCGLGHCKWASHDLEDAFCAHPKAMELSAFGQYFHAMHDQGLCTQDKLELFAPIRPQSTKE